MKLVRFVLSSLSDCWPCFSDDEHIAFVIARHTAESAGRFCTIWEIPLPPVASSASASSSSSSSSAGAAATQAESKRGSKRAGILPKPVVSLSATLGLLHGSSSSTAAAATTAATANGSSSSSGRAPMTDDDACASDFALARELDTMLNGPNSANAAAAAAGERKADHASSSSSRGDGKDAASLLNASEEDRKSTRLNSSHT